ncbi:hypothetical protein PQR53_00340 [Paraburkholderia fungorum]|jgi:hypothetical protein|uniref:hypothetical protein n=1 Tax=Paraburkholderia fungorum TaxID=134537 RepID=UPI0038BAC19B
MSPVKLFVSHTSQYGHLARSLRMSLQALQPNELLDVKIHEEMPGGVEWRKWIEDTTRAAHAFVMLYPHEDMDMGWPNFEVARFFGREADRENRVVWIRNPGMKKWPAVFEPYQAYDATADGIFKFFTETFVGGIFTEGEPLNAEIGEITNRYYELGRTAARELADQFAEATIRPQFHARRIQISMAYDKGRFNPERSQVDGNADGMKMIGMGADAEVNWASVRNAVPESITWPTELEREITSFAAGALPPCLSPFAIEDGISIPVITKSETLQSRLHRISVIFVEADVGKLRSMLDWIMPPAMPGQVATFIRVVRLMLRIRYDILEPRYQEVKFETPVRERRLAICNEVLSEYKAVNKESVRAGMQGVEAFYMLFDPSLREKLDEAIAEYIGAIRELKRYAQKLETAEPPPADDDVELCTIFKSLRSNNAHWLQIAGSQFEKFVGMWQ